MHQPKILFFDLGDTIFTSRMGAPFDYVAGFRAVLERAVSNPDNVTPEEAATVYLAFERERRIETPHGTRDLSMEIPFSTSLRCLFASRGIVLDVSWQEAAERYWRARTSYDPCDGVETMLRQLREWGIRTALITNNMFEEETIRRRLAEVLPDHRFSFLLSSADYGVAKPDSRLFRIALRLAGVDAQEAWHAGDSLSNDVNGATAVGIYPVWYTRYRAGRPLPSTDTPHLRASRWDDMTEALASITGGNHL